MLDDNHVLDLLPAYALGSLEEGEAVRVSEHLSGCLECSSELDVYQTVTSQLALGGRETDPPQGLKRRLFDQLRLPDQSRSIKSEEVKQRPVPRLLAAWSMLSLLLILVLALGSVYLWQRINLLEQSSRPGGMYAFSLNGTDILPEAAGYLIIGADGQNGAVIVDKLPPLDPDMEYQLWLIREGEFTSGASLAVDEMGYGGRRVSAPDNLLTYTAASMTIEPAGGSTSPTGEIILVGTLSGP